MVLVQQGLDKAQEREEKLPTTLSNKEKKDILDKVHSLMILSLRDKVLREVSKEKIAIAIWLKLKNMYMTKSLANMLYLKQKLYTFKMSTWRSLEDHLNDFNKIILDLENIEIKLDVEDQAVLLLRSLLSEFDNLSDTFIYDNVSLP